MNWSAIGLIVVIVIAAWWLFSGVENALRQVATAIMRLAVAVEKKNL